LLRRLRLSLKTLGISIGEEAPFDCELNGFNLSQNIALQNFSMKVPGPCVPRLLAQITSDKLANLRIGLSKEATKEVDWTRVQSILCQPMWSSTLRTVKIAIRDLKADIDAHYLNFMKAALPVLADSITLAVSVGPLPYNSLEFI